MRLLKRFSLSLVLTFAAALSLQPLALAQTARKEPAKNSAQKNGKQKPVRTGTPVLWREHPDAASLDLLNGPGGAEMQPDTSRPSPRG